MGKIYPDLAGAFTNAIGGTVYYVRFGQNLARRKGVQSDNKNFTPAQRAQQAKFGLLNVVGSVMNEVAEMGFPGRERGWTGQNVFVQANRGVCVVADDGTVTMDYARVLCADGGLTPPLVTVKMEEGVLSFESVAMGAHGKNSEADRVIGVALDPVNGYCEWKEVCTRGAGGTEVMPLPDYWQKDTVVVYTFAVSPDGKKASKSIYHALE